MAFMAAAAPILSVVGTGISFMGQMQQSAYAAQVAENNAKVAKQNAAYAKQAGAQEAINERLEGAAKGAKTTTAMAANGIDVGSASAKQVQRSERILNELDVETILHNADLTAYGYTTQSQNFVDQAKQERAAGIWKGFSTLIDGASSVAGNWNPTAPQAPAAPTSWAKARQSLGYG